MFRIPLRYSSWNVYIDNAIFAGTASVDIGDISHDTVEVSGSGIAGTVAIPGRGQVGSFQITLHHHVANRDTFRLVDGNKHTLELRPAIDTFNTITRESGEVYQAIFCEVFNVSQSFGSIAPNTDPGATTTHEVIYIRVDEGGETIYELDKFAQIERVLIGGKLVDQLESRRNNL